ncbi:MAG TPA: 16S rRNA (guanine(527)-N(7))-methyltransferase RsmG, partial [Candidatus Polarisedimenticolia bacterium]|nr:16S rRNA (guanine(527)-N(7))-methyltransferase RsmG [Candidatus Polarisedimenticolia bacterium]
WNRAVRLVGDPSPDIVIRRHILESLALLPFIKETRGSLLDIGSGNGYPAIPLKCALPDLRLTMLEPTLRKSLFLEQVIRELGLSDATVIRGRIDRPRDLTRLGRWDQISMRGVAVVHTVLAAAASSLRGGGRLLLMLGASGTTGVRGHVMPPLEVLAEQRIASSGGGLLVVGLTHADLADHETH